MAALHFITSSTNLVGLRPGLARRHFRCTQASILPHHFITSSPDLVGLRPDVSVPWNPSLGLRRVDFDVPGDSFSSPEGLLVTHFRPPRGSLGFPGSPRRPQIDPRRAPRAAPETLSKQGDRWWSVYTSQQAPSLMPVHKSQPPPAPASCANAHTSVTRK